MKVLTIEGLADAEPIISKFEGMVKGRIQFPKPLIEVVEDWLKDGKAEIGLKTKNETTVIGFGVLLPSQNRILALYVDDLDGELEQSEVESNEIELLDWCLQTLENPPQKIEFPGLTRNMKESLLMKGYSEIERVGMVAKRDLFATRRKIVLPDEYSIASYNPETKAQVADVIAKANENHTDAIIYPEFFGSKDAGVDYLKKLENGAFGEYKQEYSKVVMTAEGKIVGYNLITITGDFAAISAIGIHPDFQRKGLGQALLVNSLIDILESNPDVKAIGLAVTLSNPAKLLYEKHGFTVCDEFSSIIRSWTGKSLKPIVFCSFDYDN